MVDSRRQRWWSQRSPFLPLAVTLVLICAEACTLLPLQLGRVVQYESYEVTFDLGLDPGESGERRARRANRAFEALLGSGNWRTLQERYGAVFLLDELTAETVYVTGRTSILLYPSRAAADAFLMEGVGRFAVVRRLLEGPHQILLSGDSFIETQTISRDDLRSGRLKIEVRYLVTRIPASQTYYHEDASARFIIGLEPELARKSVYQIDYDGDHEVLLVGLREEEWVIGNLRFDPAGAEAKVTELRGTRLLRRKF